LRCLEDGDALILLLEVNDYGAAAGPLDMAISRKLRRLGYSQAQNPTNTPYVVQGSLNVVTLLSRRTV
jgi:hypothetical protein